MLNFGEFVATLEQMGIRDVILPFLLIFTIVFAVLQKTKVLGPESKRFNSIVALVIGLAVIFPHVANPGGPNDVVLIINSALPDISLLMLASLSVLLLIGVFGPVDMAGGNFEIIILVFAVIAVGISFVNAAGANLPPWLDFLVDNETRDALVALGVFALVIWFITREEKQGNTQAFRNIREGLFGSGGLFGGKGGH